MKNLDLHTSPAEEIGEQVKHVTESDRGMVVIAELHEDQQEYTVVGKLPKLDEHGSLVWAIISDSLYAMTGMDLESFLMDQTQVLKEEQRKVLREITTDMNDLVLELQGVGNDKVNAILKKHHETLDLLFDGAEIIATTN